MLQGGGVMVRKMIVKHIVPQGNQAAWIAAFKARDATMKQHGMGGGSIVYADPNSPNTLIVEHAVADKGKFDGAAIQSAIQAKMIERGFSGRRILDFL
jgi:hypothetical protein